MKFWIPKLAVISVLLPAPLMIFAQTVIENDAKVSGTWSRTGSPYLIKGEAIISGEAVLTIEPGVVLQFRTGNNSSSAKSNGTQGFLNVKGKLIAVGTQTDTIQFTRDGTIGKWGVVLFNSSSSESILRYCKIEHASEVKNTDLKLTNLSMSGALSFYQTEGTIENCSIVNNKEAGIFIRNSKTIIRHCIISLNTVGLGCTNATPKSINNTIIKNKAGFQLENSNPIITNTIIYDNEESFDFFESNNPEITYSFIENRDEQELLQVIGTNIFGRDPIFNDSQNGDYSLARTSPCIGAGKNGVDMGALSYETISASKDILSFEKQKSAEVEKGDVDSLPSLVKRLFGKTRTWAVIIGINNYSKTKNGYIRLPYSVADARDFRNSLVVNMGISENRIFTLYNTHANKKNIERLLGDRLPKELSPNDRLLFYFSGHGDTHSTSGRSFGYLIPADGKKDSLYSTCISMKQISDFSDLIPAKQILFVIDACYSGIAGIINKGSDEDIAKLRKVSETQLRIFIGSRGRQVMTAGTSGEKAMMGQKWDHHSVYTYYLLKGLKGAADYNNDEIVSALELQVYLSTHVSRDTEYRQNPQLYSLGVSEGQFIFFPEGRQ